jgi:hypothetical protein
MKFSIGDKVNAYDGVYRFTGEIILAHRPVSLYKVKILKTHNLTWENKYETPIVWFHAKQLRKLKKKKPKREPRVLWVNEYENGLAGNHHTSKEFAKSAYCRSDGHIRCVKFVEDISGDEK